ncbi:hypothetical protein BDN72DRAFT_242280 [Pluteus cervinus]|uniref:Uncharacterized protein n=1 Tax=Pluteus cervinus TaxID=181527 RepID=A0ACD3BFV7_9AGAR|nr:hypothetical protein BDN72DRAFT_242280 [Pluteus cervinus]
MFWYLMIVLLFQPKAEAARISCFLVIQTGGTIAFAIFRNKFSCRVFNTRSTCEMAASIVVYAGWGVSGLALLYLFFLALMSYVQYPTPDNPDGTVFDHLETERDRVEASGGQLLLDENTLKTENQEQDPKHQSYYSAAAQSSLAFDLRPPSVRTSEYYFPSRPDSTYSASSRYLRAPERAIPAEEAIAGPSSSAPEPAQYGGSRLLPNPFDEPISRDNTPMSLLSDSSSVYGYGVGNGKRTLPRRPEETMSRTLSGRSERYHPPPPYVNESQIAIASPDKTQLVIIPKCPLTGASLSIRQRAASIRPCRSHRHQYPTYIVPLRSLESSPHLSLRSMF